MSLRVKNEGVEHGRLAVSARQGQSVRLVGALLLLLERYDVLGRPLDRLVLGLEFRGGSREARVFRADEQAWEEN